MSNEDTLKLIGKVLPPGIHADRDAIHVAVLPVISDEEYICAGMRLNFKYGSRTNVVRAKGREYDDPGVGIADPFLIEEVKLGQRFFMFMKPGSVTGMRHHWNHAGVDTVFPEESESEKWMRTFAQKWNFNYEELIQEASASDQRGEGGYDYNHYIVAMGRDLHSASELGEDHDLFWRHLEVLTGKKFNDKHQRNFGWSCSC